MARENPQWPAESKDAADSVSAASLCALPLPTDGAILPCPVCARVGTLMAIGDSLMCAACGYASDSAAGCT